jgi:hypothetical protein
MLSQCALRNVLELTLTQGLKGSSRSLQQLGFYLRRVER